MSFLTELDRANARMGATIVYQEQVIAAQAKQIEDLKKALEDSKTKHDQKTEGSPKDGKQAKNSV